VLEAPPNQMLFCLLEAVTMDGADCGLFDSYYSALMTRYGEDAQDYAALFPLVDDSDDPLNEVAEIVAQECGEDAGLISLETELVFSARDALRDTQHESGFDPNEDILCAPPEE